MVQIRKDKQVAIVKFFCVRYGRTLSCQVPLFKYKCPSHTCSSKNKTILNKIHVSIVYIQLMVHLQPTQTDSKYL